MYALGNVYRLQGRIPEAFALLKQLYDVVLATQSPRSDNAVGLAKTLCDMCNEVRSWGKTAIRHQQELYWRSCLGAGNPDSPLMTQSYFFYRTTPPPSVRAVTNHDNCNPPPALPSLPQMGDHTKATEYAEAALSSMQLVVGGFHPALGPYFQLLAHCLAQSGDEAGSERVKKAYLKLTVQFKAQEGRGGNGPAAGGSPAKAAAGAGKSKKKGGR